MNRASGVWEAHWTIEGRFPRDLANASGPYVIAAEIDLQTRDRREPNARLPHPIHILVANRQIGEWRWTAQETDEIRCKEAVVTETGKARQAAVVFIGGRECVAAHGAV